MSSPVAFVLKGYPRLSETFIAQEIRSLEERGLDIQIISLRHPTDRYKHPVHSEITAGINYLPEYVYQEPGRVWQAWRRTRRLPGYNRAQAQWLKDWRRDPSSNRGRRFAQAMVLADELPAEVRHIHAHFLHTPASVARYCAMILGCTWSCSAHAKDIWTIPDWEKSEKLRGLEWLSVCSRAAQEHLRKLAQNQDTEKIHLNYHGIDLQRFATNSELRAGMGPVKLISVGRAVEKKGYNDLLKALSILPSTLDWRLAHIGGGPMLPKLQELANSLDLADRIEWRGAQPQAEVLAAYRQADIFVLASRIAGDGDRDGLPNVLMEAQSQGLAVVASNIAAIPELVKNGETGLLVPQRQPEALAAALQTLIENRDLRASLAAAGEARVRQHFGHERLLDPLARCFGLPEKENIPEPTKPEIAKAGGRA